MNAGTPFPTQPIAEQIEKRDHRSGSCCNKDGVGISYISVSGNGIVRERLAVLP